jgi:hypothetical protein
VVQRICAVAVAVVLAVPLSTTPAVADIDLAWNECLSDSGVVSDVSFDCAAFTTSRTLLGHFQPHATIAGFVALEASIDIRVDAPALPPFWHFEPGGCNSSNPVLYDAPPSGACTTIPNPWGPAGGQADAFVTAYSPGFGAPNRARLLLSVVRASSNPFPLTAGDDYFGFRLDFDAPSSAACGGCSTPADIVWSTGTLYSNATGFPADVLTSEYASNHVTVNGGGADMSVLASLTRTSINDQTLALSATGYGIAPGATATLMRSGEADIPAQSPTVQYSGSWIGGLFDVHDRAGGLWDLRVENPGGASDTLHNALELVERFRIVSIDPTSAIANGWITATVHGYGFEQGMVWRLERAGELPISPYTPVISADGRTITGNFELTGKPAGARDVVVGKPDGPFATLPGGFTLFGGDLDLDAVDPGHGANTGQVVLTLRGQGMTPTLSARLFRAGQPDIAGTGIAVSTFGDTARATFDITGRAVGLWSIEIRNGPDGAAQLPNAFAIHAPRSLATVSPAVGGNTATIVLTVTGSGFESGVALSLRSGATVIPGAGLGFATDGLSATATFDLTDRALGPYDVVAQFPFGETRTLPGAFEIRNGLRVLSITPVTGADTAFVSATITGTLFQPGAIATLRGNGMPDIVGVTSAVAADGTSLDATFDLRGKPRGARDVRVTNPDAVFAARAAAFTILSVPRPASIAPTTGFDDDSLVVTITGANFAPPVLVKMIRGASVVFGANTVMPDTGRIRTRFSLQGKPVGLWDIEVTNSGGFTGTLPQALEVRKRLVLNFVSPTIGSDTGPISLLLTGRAFVSGTTVALRRLASPDIPGTGVSVAPDGNSLTASFDLTGKPAGHWDVEVRNPDGQVATIPAGFTISGTPHATAVAPDHGPDSRAILLTVTGSNFSDGAAMRLERSGESPIVATNVTGTVTGTELQGTFDLRDRAVGLWDLVVEQSGVTSTLPQSFEIQPLLSLDSVTPDRMLVDQIATLVIHGRHMTAGATALLRRSGHTDVAGQSATVATDGRSLEASFDATGMARGLWSVVVTNPGGATASLDSSVTVVSAVPEAPLSLLWGACSDATPPGGENVVFDCADLDAMSRLFANFRPTQSVHGAVAFSGVIDLWFDGPLPPFWHLEAGGCNAGNLAISDDRDESVCPAARNETVWGAGGQRSDAFILAYGAGYGGFNRARLLVSVNRASSDPFDLEEGVNYFGFELDFFMGQAADCNGCEVPLNISWSTAVIESPLQAGGEAVALVLYGDSGFPSVAKVNGGVNFATPTRLAEFDTAPAEDGISVTWQFADAGAYSAVSLERRDAGREEWTVVGSYAVTADRTSFVDRDVQPGAAYDYRLVATTRGGAVETFGPITAEAPSANAATFSALSVQPNPMRNHTDIRFTLAREADVKITIVDVQGRERALLVAGRQTTGRHVTRWDGRIEGAAAPAGVYFVRCDLEGRATMKRIHIVR